MNKSVRIFFAALVWITLFSCSSDDKRFRLVNSKESGITFKNTLTESLEFNIFNYMYFYNGAGVATGDMNGDGLLDIYFTSNQEPNKLYLNQGNFKFKDVTETAGVEGFKGWATGVTIADVNSDGKLDIYVGFLGDHLIFKGKNQLFINEGNDANGIPQFTDRAIEYGLDLVGFATQAAFFDYDKDGDLDMFMLNHSIHENGTFGSSKGLRLKSHPLAGDKLMRNDNNRFIDVTKQAGIYDNAIGYGLGVVVSDVNLDGWPDIYVGNDFHENDYLYINQHDGTFKETLEQSMNHTSRYTMGVDFADFNNDAFPDLISMDMLPEDHYILKASAAEDAYDMVEFKLNYGYNYQYSRNTLQLNQHDGTFSEIGRFAGVHATDWSWAGLFADFDLDGYKDIIVANGILRRSNDLDYINFITVDSIQMKMKYNMTEKEVDMLKKMPKIKIANFLYRNNHDSTFTNMATQWGLDQISYSNGAAYADFDNDGDLDLVMNNVNDEAFLYENTTIGGEKKTGSNFLSIKFEGNAGNQFGVGTKVILYQGKELQIQECMPTRGYESSVDYRLNFGTGQNTALDSVTIIWPNDSFQTLKSVKCNQWLTVRQSDATGKFDYDLFHKQSRFFQKDEDKLGINYKHRENKFVEFNREALIPHMVSAEGPGAAIADVNGDGLEDIFIGGAKWQMSGLFLQTSAGKFVQSHQHALERDSVQEDVDAVFVDVDNDKDQDLVVVSGGNEFNDTSAYLMPRLYVNNGKGEFARSKGLPAIYSTGSCISANDFDKDGDVDLFLGSRAVPWNYGLLPDGYLLENDGKGGFIDVTATKAPALKKVGMLKDSNWVDIDNDGDDDLVLAGEWMPITIFYNDKNMLAPKAAADDGLQGVNGFWNNIATGDFDKDGDIDLFVGNMGLNSKLQATVKEPITLYVKDFDNNGKIDQVLTHYVKGVEYAFYTRDEMVKQMPGLKKKYLSYANFAKATFKDMFDAEALQGADRLSANTFENSYFENLGNGKFKRVALDKPAQFSTIAACIVEDFDGDGNLDVLTAGNFYPINIQMGRYDASYGLLMRGNGRGGFKSMAPFESGFSVTGEVRKMKKLTLAGKVHYVMFRNNSTIESFYLKNK